MAFPWAELVRRRADDYHWTPKQVMEETSVLQHLVVWGLVEAAKESKTVGAAGVRKILNEVRANRHGLPPMRTKKR